MTEAAEAAEATTRLIKLGMGALLREVISGLYDAFPEGYRFYEADGKIYMEDDENRYPAVPIGKLPHI